MANKRFVLIMYMLLLFFLIGLARTIIFNVYVYGINMEPPVYKIVFIGDKKLIGAIEERFNTEATDDELADNMVTNKNKSVTWDYFFQQGSFLNSFFSSVVGYNEERINLPRVSETDENEKNTNNNEANNVYDLGDGYLVNIIPERDNSELVQHVSEFKSFLDERGIEYIFFLAPGKISREEDAKLPFFLNNHSNINADNLLEMLSYKKIHTFDLRDEFEKEDDYRSFFYKNDHHWNNKATLLAAKITAKEICDVAGLEYKEALYDIKNYDYYFYGNRFFGSLIGDSSIMEDNNQKSDYVLYLPKFKTDFSTASIRGDYDTDGTMEELLCKWDKLNDLSKDNELIYNSFGIGETGAIRNNISNNNYKILVLADSYAYSYVPYLALQFKEIKRINLRSYQDSIREYIEKEKPDMVIQINDQDNNRYSFDNPEELWDFK